MTADNTMAEVQLKQNWAGYPPGKIVSVSRERAAYLVGKLKVGRYTEGQLEINKKSESDKKVVNETVEDKLAKAKKK